MPPESSACSVPLGLCGPSEYSLSCSMLTWECFFLLLGLSFPVCNIGAQPRAMLLELCIAADRDQLVSQAPSFQKPILVHH